MNHGPWIKTPEESLEIETKRREASGSAQERSSQGDSK
jgi:hypothetical protein